MNRREALGRLAKTAAAMLAAGVPGWATARREQAGTLSPGRGERVLIVVPCSIRKRPGGEPGLKWDRERSAVSGLSSESAAHLMEARRALAHHLGLPRGDDLGGGIPTAEPLLPAWLRFDGNLYRRIDRLLWERLQSCGATQVVIVSALYGLLTPWEAVRDYQLTINDPFDPGVRLARWWSERGLGSWLAEYAQKSRAAVVQDFLSGAYRAIDRELDQPGNSARIERPAYPGLGHGSDYYRGRDIRNLLAARCGASAS